MRFIEKVKLPVYFFLIFDVVFYTAHTISHQSMIIKQTMDSIFSMCLAIALLCLLTLDTINLVVDVINLKRPTKRELIEKLLAKNIQAARAAWPDKTLSEITRVFRKRHLDAVNKTFTEFENKLSFRPAEDRFVHGGIKTTAVDNRKAARLFNLLTVLKTMMMEVIFISMQANNSLQISLLLLIQSSFFSYLVYCTAVKIFKSKWQVTVTLLYEACLLGYFVLTCVIHASGNSIYSLATSSTTLQTVVISFLVVAAFCGLAIVGVAFSQTAIRLLRKRKSKESIQADEENTKILHELTDKMNVDGYLESLVAKRKTDIKTKEDASKLDLSSAPLVLK